MNEEVKKEENQVEISATVAASNEAIADKPTENEAIVDANLDQVTA